MSWSDWEYVWRRQKPPVGKDADLAALIETYEAKRRKTAKLIVARDYAEAITGLFVSIVIAWAAWHLKKGAWLAAIAVVLVMGVVATFFRERLRARHRHLAPNASMLEKLDAEIAEMRHQRQMVASVGAWYFLPLTLAIILFGAALFINTPPHSPIREPVILAGFSLFQAFFIAFAWVINRQALRKRLDPRIEELEKLREHLVAEKHMP